MACLGDIKDFSGRAPFPTSRMRNEYQVSADGERILINEPVEGTSAYAVHALVN